MNFTYVLIKMLELFTILIIGYIANKAGVLKKEGRLNLSKLVLNITLPATILASVLAQENLPQVGQILKLILVALLSYVILFLSAFLVPIILRVKPNQKGIYRFMLAFGNVGFIGYPVTQAIFGNGAVFYTSVFNLPFNLFVYSIGVGMIKTGLEVGDDKENKINLKTFMSPCMICAVLAIILALLQVKAPVMIGETCTLIGNITTPAALMIIGSSLADMPVMQMINNVKIYLFSIIRLLVVPIITFLIFRMFITDSVLLGVSVLMAAMPVANNGTMLCLQYNADEELMAQGTFITTLFSVITIPLISILLI